MARPARTPYAEITAAEVRRRWEAGTRDVARELREFETAKAFYSGQQWVRWDETTRTVKPAARDEGRIRRTNNRLTGSTGIVLAKFLRRPLVFEVPPMASDDATVQGSRIAAAVAHHAHREHDWEALRTDRVLAAWLGGTGLLALDWDPRASTSLGTDPETGRDFGKGDVRCAALSLSQVATAPGVADIERARFWIRAEAMVPEDAQEAFGLAEKPPADTTASTDPVRSPGDASERQRQRALTLVLWYYERPCGSSPGQVAAVIGERLVDGPRPWPFPFKDRLNVVAVKQTHTLNRWTGDAMMWHAALQQTGLNLAESSIAEHMKLASNARLRIPRGSIQNPEDLTDQPGEWFEFDPVLGMGPEWMSPPTMPQWWAMEPARIKADIDDQLNVHDITRGLAPPGVTAGVALNLLAEQDDTPTGWFSRKDAEAWARFATMVLQVYEAEVRGERRQARVDVPGQAPETREWSGEAFQGQTVASVPFDAVSPVSRTAQFSQAMALWSAGVLTDPKAFARMAEMPSADDFTAGLDPHLAKAKRENHMLALGGVTLPNGQLGPAPAPFDNHLVHIPEHNVFRTSPRYEELDADGQALVDLHVAGHETMAAEEAGAMQAKAAASPALAAAAQGSEPAPLPSSDVPAPIALVPGAAGVESVTPLEPGALQ